MDTDKLVFASNAAAATSSVFSWRGGWMAFIGSATWGGGSAKLQFLGPDASTWIDFPSGSLSANGMLLLQLPPGQYRSVTATGSAFYVMGVRVPTNVNH